MRFRSTSLQPSRGQPARGQKNKHSGTNSPKNRKSQKLKVDKSHKETSPPPQVQPIIDRTLSKAKLQIIKSLPQMIMLHLPCLSLKLQNALFRGKSELWLEVPRSRVIAH